MASIADIIRRFIGFPIHRKVKHIETTLEEVLCSSPYFLQNVHSPIENLVALQGEISSLEKRLSLSLGKTNHAVGAILRQALLTLVIPAKAFDDTYTGSIDDALSEHLNELGIDISKDARVCVRNICLNVRKLRALDGTAARNATKKLSDIRTMGQTYNDILYRQNHRCIWCGVNLVSPNIKASLEHMAPKHLGDDMPDTSNWAIACTTCNSGKGETLAWSSSAFSLGFLRARHFVDPFSICGEVRWAVLVRDRKCDTCGVGPDLCELGVHLQVQTGLPIPLNCSTTCGNCATLHGKKLLKCQWDDKEVGRKFP